MIPILYAPNERSFTSNGLCRLPDCVSCVVTEERNGIYECEFQYPITGEHFDDILEGRIISVTHDEQKDRQPFIIYRHSAPINGIVTFYAHHVSYMLSNVILRPMTATSTADAFAQFETGTMTENAFTFWTDKTGSGSLQVDVPSSLKAVLGGTEGSVLDVFGGGEYEWDNYLVRLYQNRGRDNGVTIRYGKNLTNITAVYDTLDLYNAVVPFWRDSDGNVVYGGIVYGSGGIMQTAYWTDENNVRITDENGAEFTFDYAIVQTLPMDLSSEFDDAPTVAQLEDKALSILNSNEPWIPNENIRVDFVALWQTEEYADVAPLERVRLCDTVTVRYPALNVDTAKKVIKTEWNVLLDRYDAIELGVSQSSFAEVIMADTEEKLADVASVSMMEEAIQHATDLITGGLGGHIVFLYDANGKPTDMLVMDTEDVATAVHVLRINVNGIGFSSTGVSGTYTSAWTLDGRFVADFITAGTMSANRIQGGTLTLGGANNGNGVLSIRNASNTEIGRWSNAGISITSGSINLGNGLFVVTDAGYLTSVSGNIGGFTIGASGIYNGKSSIDEHKDGIYIGTNGISFGAKNGFKVTASGEVTANGTFEAASPQIYAKMSSGILTLGDSTSTYLEIYENELQSDYQISHTGTGHYFSVWSNSSHTAKVGLFYTSGSSGVTVNGNLTVTGTKSRGVAADEYGKRQLYCYETASPVFGDIGEGTISEDGLCYVAIDSVFANTVTLTQYQVFLQNYGNGECYVAERTPAFFVVKGTPGLMFGWELKAKQADFDQLRLERWQEVEQEPFIDYAGLAVEHINALIEGRLSA